MKLIATKSFSYANRRLVAGDAFETRGESDGRLLIAIGSARLAPEVLPTPAAPKQQPAVPRETEAAADPQPALAPEVFALLRPAADGHYVTKSETAAAPTEDLTLTTAAESQPLVPAPRKTLRKVVKSTPAED